MCWRRTSGGSGGPRPTILRCGSWFLLRGKIDRFLAKVKEAGRFDLGQQDDPQAILQKLGYISHDQPAWAAMLLFARDPLRHHIHIGRFKTPSHIIDDRQFTDTLFEVTEQAMKFIVSHLSVAFEFDGSVQRKERFSYPLPALREALVNAIVHRDYTDGSDIQIKIFDDRITIYSPGRLYGGLRLEDLYTNHYPSKLRNKLVAEAFYLTGNIEKYGSGFIRIRKALEDYPEVRLEIRESGHGLLLSFLRRGSAFRNEMVGMDRRAVRLLRRSRPCQTTHRTRKDRRPPGRRRFAPEVWDRCGEPSLPIGTRGALNARAARQRLSKRDGRDGSPSRPTFAAKPPLVLETRPQP
jgi:hypothetical protein